MKNIPALLLIILFVHCKGPQDTSIHYPPPPPEDSIVTFLPGIVSAGADSIDFNAAFSPDGQSFYFTRSKNRKWVIYESHFDGKQWTKATRAAFNDTAWSMADPAFGPDGYLYFISDLPRTASDTIWDFDIWFVKPLTNGKWSAPENLLAVNTDSTEYYVSFSPRGDLYFASSRTGGYGLEDIYISKRIEGKYSQPENLGNKINTAFSDHDPCLSQQEDFMIYTSVDRKEGLGEGDLYLARKDAKGQWSEVRSMGIPFNTNTYEYCSYFSPDFKYFFFSSRRDVKWMHTSSLLKMIQK